MVGESSTEIVIPPWRVKRYECGELMLMLCRLQTTCWRSFCILHGKFVTNFVSPIFKFWTNANSLKVKEKTTGHLTCVAVLSLVCTDDLQELLHLQFLFLYDTKKKQENIKWVSHKSSYFFFAVEYETVLFQPFVAWAMTSNLFAKCHGLFFSKSVLRSNFSMIRK